LLEKISAGEIRFTPDGRGIRRRTYLEDMKGLPPSTLWTELDETGHNRQAKYELKQLFPEVPTSSLFATPKPERLIKRILDLATDVGDTVLDSFAGSGTTGAVAHKMNRRWIMIELGNHCHTYVIPRMQKVIDGRDPGGISGAVDWNGGGGFRYLKLAPSLLERDKWGRWIVNRDYNSAMLTEALCKLEGFSYAPSDTIYWQQGWSTESDFIYVTTASMNADQLSQLSDEVGGERSLLVLCPSFRGGVSFPNLTVRKIPKQVLSRCEWGHDDYSLRVENLPQGSVSSIARQASLFGEGSEL
jgi:adenine-specific DNA-methyltransferase